MTYPEEFLFNDNLDDLLEKRNKRSVATIDLPNYRLRNSLFSLSLYNGTFSDLTTKAENCRFLRLH